MNTVLCIKDFIIDGIPICKKGLKYKIVDTKTYTNYDEDVYGYVDIQDTNGNVICWATWIDIDESGCFELVLKQRW